MDYSERLIMNDDWLSSYEDHEEIFQGDEDEAYDRWKDEQLEDEEWKI